MENVFDRRILRKMTNALSSLSNSTFIGVRVPFGPQVLVWGRNGRNMQWHVADYKPADARLDAYFLLDNGKYSVILSPYYNSLDIDITLIFAVMPIQTTLPIFRGVGDVFLASSDVNLRSMFFPTSTVNVYLTNPYKQLLRFN